MPNLHRSFLSAALGITKDSNKDGKAKLFKTLPACNSKFMTAILKAFSIRIHFEVTNNIL